MSYTESEKAKVLSESKEERHLKNYFKSLQPFGEDFVSKSVIVKGDMINSMRLFSTEDIASTSEEIAILMIKSSLLTYNHSRSVTFIKRLMLKDKPLKEIIDFVLICKQVKVELAKNVYYQRESNPVSQFNILYRDANDETKEKVLDCINRLNCYMESIKEKEIEERRRKSDNRILALKRGKSTTSQSNLKMPA